MPREMLTNYNAYAHECDPENDNTFSAVEIEGQRHLALEMFELGLGGVPWDQIILTGRDGATGLDAAEVMAFASWNYGAGAECARINR